MMLLRPALVSCWFYHCRMPERWASISRWWTTCYSSIAYSSYSRLFIIQNIIFSTELLIYILAPKFILIVFYSPCLDLFFVDGINPWPLINLGREAAYGGL
jgi:hypothetical protein